MPQRLCVAVLSILALAGTASAQLVTPPTEAPAKTEPLPMPAEDSFVKPAAPQMGSMPVRPPAPPADAIPPDLTWEKLAKFDDKGNLIRISLPAEAAAIAVNPLLNDQTRALVNAYLAERKTQVENLILSNLDIAEDFDSDKLLKINVMNKEELSWFTKANQPFKLPTVSNELVKRGVFSTLQAKVNSTIAKEYTDAEYKDTVKAAEAAAGKKLGPLDTLPYLIRDQAVGESLAVRRALMIEASTRFDALLPSLGLSGEATAAAAAISKEIAAAKTDKDRLAAIEKTRTAFSVEQRRTLLKKTIELRPAAK